MANDYDCPFCQNSGCFNCETVNAKQEEVRQAAIDQLFPEVPGQATIVEQEEECQDCLRSYARAHQRGAIPGHHFERCWRHRPAVPVTKKAKYGATPAVEMPD